MATGKLCSSLQSSIIKKQIMGVTGLLLCGFALMHLAGNLLLMVSPELFNKYAHALITNPFIYPMEAGLALLFLTHIGLSIKLSIENFRARPVPYVCKKPTDRGSTFASRTMPITGFLIFIFLIFHIMDIKFGNSDIAMYNGVEMKNLHKLVVEYFQSPLNVAKYLVIMLAFGIHTSHGFWSAFQSLGINHPKYNCLIKIIGKTYAVLVAIGFSVLPVWCYLQGGQFHVH